MKTNKLFAVCLSVIMILSMLTIGAFAQGNGDFEYEVLNNGTASITKYVGTATEVVIPEKIEKFTVTSIAEEAFSGSNIKTVKIPASITDIAAGSPYTIGAFGGCSGIESITVAEGNENYISKGNCLIKKESKTLISGCKNSVIPSDGSVTVIGNAAFRGREGLTDINIPKGITNIDSFAFENCKNLKTVVIPNSVTFLGESPFWGCIGLVSAVVPESITEIYDDFLDCENVTLCVKPNSYAHKYALDNGINYSFYSENKDTDILAEMDKDAFDENAKLVVKSADKTVVTLPEKYNAEKVLIWDISFEKDGTSVKPGGKVTVRIPMPNGFNAEECVVLHMLSDGAFEEMDAQYESGYIKFTTDSFSNFVLTEKAAQSVTETTPENETSTENNKENKAETSKPAVENSSNETTSPQTGDNSFLAFYTVVLLCSIALVVMCFFTAKKLRHN